MVCVLRVRAAALLRLDNIRLLTDRWWLIFGCSAVLLPGLGRDVNASGERGERLLYGAVASGDFGLSSVPRQPTHGGGTSPSLSSFFRFSLVLRTLRGVSGLLHAEWSRCLCKAGLSLGDNGLMFVVNGCERRPLGVGGRFCLLSAVYARSARFCSPLWSSPYAQCALYIMLWLKTRLCLRRRLKHFVSITRASTAQDLLLWELVSSVLPDMAACHGDH
jgi:hypothetical protein